MKNIFKCIAALCIVISSAGYVFGERSERDGDGSPIARHSLCSDALGRLVLCPSSLVPVIPTMWLPLPAQPATPNRSNARMRLLAEYLLWINYIVPGLDSGPLTTGEWGNWGPCSVICGSGKTKRTRTCKKSNCNSEEIKECELTCAQWGTWTPEGTCSAPCGTGLQLYTRVCNIASGCVGSDRYYNWCSIADCAADITCPPGFIFIPEGGGGGGGTCQTNEG